MRRVKEHKWYQPYAEDYVKEKMLEKNVKKDFSMDLVNDLAAAASHWQNNSDPRNGFLKFDEKNVTKGEDIGQARQEFDDVQKFCDNVEWDKIPGNTPLQKAAFVTSTLDNHDEKSMQKQMKKQPGQKSKDEAMEEMLDVMYMIGGKEGGESIPYLLQDQNNKPLSQLLTPENRKLIAKLAILKDRGKIRAKRSPFTQELNAMTEYSQINKMISMSEVLLPTFQYKMAMKQLTVKRPIESAKQSLILTIDRSGSMDSYGKQDWVKAIILNRLDAVARNEAELYICWFERTVESGDYPGIYKITNKKEVKKALADNILFPRPCGGTTYVCNVVREIEQMIEKRQFGPHKFDEVVNPQIVIMNDGEDHIDPAFVPKYPTHAFILGTTNNALKKMCESSKGTYERFL